MELSRDEAKFRKASHEAGHSLVSPSFALQGPAVDVPKSNPIALHIDIRVPSRLKMNMGSTSIVISSDEAASRLFVISSVCGTLISVNIEPRTEFQAALHLSEVRDVPLDIHEILGAVAPSSSL